LFDFIFIFNFFDYILPTTNQNKTLQTGVADLDGIFNEIFFDIFLKFHEFRSHSNCGITEKNVSQSVTLDFQNLTKKNNKTNKWTRKFRTLN